MITLCFKSKYIDIVLHVTNFINIIHCYCGESPSFNADDKFCVLVAFVSPVTEDLLLDLD